MVEGQEGTCITLIQAESIHIQGSDSVNSSLALPGTHTKISQKGKSCQLNIVRYLFLKKKKVPQIF